MIRNSQLQDFPFLSAHVGVVFRHAVASGDVYRVLARYEFLRVLRLHAGAQLPSRDNLLRVFHAGAVIPLARTKLLQVTVQVFRVCRGLTFDFLHLRNTVLEDADRPMPEVAMSFDLRVIFDLHTVVSRSRDGSELTVFAILWVHEVAFNSAAFRHVKDVHWLQDFKHADSSFLELVGEQNILAVLPVNHEIVTPAAKGRLLWFVTVLFQLPFDVVLQSLLPLLTPLMLRVPHLVLVGEIFRIWIRLRYERVHQLRQAVRIRTSIRFVLDVCVLEAKLLLKTSHAATFLRRFA